MLDFFSSAEQLNGNSKNSLHHDLKIPEEGKQILQIARSSKAERITKQH